MDRLEKSFSLLNHYQNEWMHRHSHYWKILSSLYITNLIIICFPLCSTHFNIEFVTLNVNPKIFPAIGIIFTIVCSSLLMFESYKLMNLRNCINSLLNQIEKKTISKKKNIITLYIKKYINFIVTVIFSVSMILISIYFIYTL